MSENGFYVDRPGAELALQTLLLLGRDDNFCYLELGESIFINHHVTKGWQVHVNCNDAFWWGTVDAELVTESNFAHLLAAYTEIVALEESGADLDKLSGAVSILFAARERGMRPQGAIYKHLAPEVWPLLDACGPERAPDILNPHRSPTNV